MSAVVKLPISPPDTDCSNPVYVIDPARAAQRARKRRVTPAERAAAEAERVIQAAEAEAELIRRRAAEQGYEEGIRQGRMECAERIAELEKLKDGILEERESFFAHIEPQVVKLSVEIAEKILRHEISSNSEAVLSTVRAALRQLKDKESVKLRVNPADREVVASNRDALRESVDGIRSLEVIEDRRVDRGGCIAESAGGGIDARIAGQLSEVMRALQEAGGHDTGSADTGPDQVLQDSEPDEHAST